MSTAIISETISAHPDLIRKVEKGILNEARHEEQNFKDTLKDLSKTAKMENKAHRAAIRAERALEKAEQHEQKTLKNIYKAEQAHDIAITNVHEARHELEMSTKNDGKFQRSVKMKRERVEDVIKANDENTKERNIKLTALRGPVGTSESGRVVPAVEGAAASTAQN
ncbi:hypothetical protein NLJ89_g8240 [Agrocybe chaxingu]|uniref:Uncharacterized protein n=1 Tax=Agrocybe chaxingu TaxID=84603 RepID=A0A9W8MUP4_9AGAR|nr:hypothetical protein NLJ89_g8240 [Agrocybe chaxingu]